MAVATVLICTYNRADLLGETLDSLARSRTSLSWNVIVVDNNSTDQTRSTVEKYRDDEDSRVRYVFEQRQGRSSALNAGIESTGSDLIGMIDDDEEVDANWLHRVSEAFAGSDVDFVGGPYIPNWSLEPPRWLPHNYLGVIGWIDGGNRIVQFGERYPGILMGGNAVLTRQIIRRVGLYNPVLSRTGRRLLAGEDEDMYKRLLKTGARGFYLPDLIIYHYVPPERLTKRYFRRWCFWRGVSRGLLDCEAPSPVAYLAGVPRWLYGRAARGLVDVVRRRMARVDAPDESFSSELAFWDLAGFFYGKHFYRPR